MNFVKAATPLSIVNPPSGSGLDNLCSTHPAVENRSAALKEPARRIGGHRPAPGFLATAMGWPWPPVPRRGPWG